MALTETPPQTTETPAGEQAAPSVHPRTEPTLVERLVGSGDHQLIGRMFVGLSLLLGAANLVAGGLRDLDVASNAKIFEPEVTQRLLLNHLVGLFLCGILPLLLGIAICVVPRQLGSPAIAFHRAASAALWTWVGSSVLFVVAVAADGSYGGANPKLARLGNVATGGLMVSLLVASLCIAVTVLSYRPAGMSLDRVPFFSFSMLVTATILIFTLPAALAHVVLGQISRANPDTLVTSTYAGIAWLFTQPGLFVVLVPVLGILADVVATATGARQQVRGVLLGLIGAAGLLSFGAWAQGQAAQSTFLWVVVSVAFVLPVIGVLGAVGDTLRRGRLRFISPLAFSILAVLVALLGWVTGGFLAVNTAGKGYLTDFDRVNLSLGQYRLVVGAALVGALGALFYWGKQIFGAALPETAGKGLAPLAAVAVVVWGAAPVVSGMVKGGSVRPLAGVAAAGAFLTALVLLAVLGAGSKALSTSLRGDVVLADPWGTGGTLEWAEAGPDAPIVHSAYPVLDANEGES